MLLGVSPHWFCRPLSALCPSILFIEQAQKTPFTHLKSAQGLMLKKLQNSQQEGNCDNKGKPTPAQKLFSQPASS